MPNKITGKIIGKITGKMPNKITNKIIGKITGNITGKNFTGSGAGSVMGRFAGSVMGRFAGSVIGSFKGSVMGRFAGLFMGVFFVGLLFSLVAGVGNLQAQERQQGWFVGVSPFVMDVKLKKTSRRVGEERTQVSELVSEDVGVSDANAISYDANVPNFALNATHTNRFGDVQGNNLAVVNTAIGHAISLCQNGAIPTTDIGTISLVSYDATESLTDDLSQLLQNTTPTKTGLLPKGCKDFFDSELPDPSAPVTTVLPEYTEKIQDKTTEETSKLKGTGISFGFNFEKYSLSFNQLQWSAGDDKLQAQVLLARYFLPYGFSVGGGLASTKLGTVFGSASGTAPALHFGYNRAITKNLQVEVGLFWLGLDLAVADTQIINSAPTTTNTTSTLPTTAPTIKRRAIVGLQRFGGEAKNNYNALKGTSGGTPYDTRIVVTATIPSGVSTTTTTNTTKTVSGTHHQTAKIKNPATISINFIWRFR